MNYLVVGAGNASRPVARLLNHLGHNVIITDLKEITAFKNDVQRLKIFKIRGERNNKFHFK